MQDFSSSSKKHFQGSAQRSSLASGLVPKENDVNFGVHLKRTTSSRSSSSTGGAPVEKHNNAGGCVSMC